MRPPGFQDAPRLGEERLRLRDVVHDVGHHDRAEGTVGERQATRVGYQPYALAEKHLRRDRLRTELREEARAGAQLEHAASALRQDLDDALVPLAVDFLKEWLASGEVAAYRGGARVVRMQAPGQRMGQQPADHRHTNSMQLSQANSTMRGGRPAWRQRSMLVEP